MNPEEHIALQDCKHGFLYFVQARNFEFGVFNKHERGFVGIRTKFGAKYLDLEFHWDTGAPYGTCAPLKELEELPVDIEPVVRFCDVDEATGREVYFDSTRGMEWRFKDTDEVGVAIKPTEKKNIALFEFLQEKAEQYKDVWRK